MKDHLLIAGCGYLGEEIARLATNSGLQVTRLSKSGENGSLACDLSLPSDLTGLRSQISPPSSIMFTASSGRGGVEAYRSVFLEGTRNLSKTFPDSRLLFTSSTSVYHQTDGSLVTEESSTEPERETGEILLEAESQVLSENGTVARLAGIYGPGRSAILRSLFRGDAVIEEDGRRFLNQIHRDDASTALLHLLTCPESAGQIYNVCDSSPLHQGDCYYALAALFDLTPPPNGPKPQNRKRAWTHKRVSNEKLRGTGWEPTYPSFIDAADAIGSTL
ncbi:MAG TPA: hypothetical protein DIV39_00080 [Verrucomicrobiales bacterium]|nr:hypothetical protein [Verrucomicrobiales bacterium]|tara:strand:+ start:2563 stop:3390 length:828 start_codon:yes stop_codon:yes gene_type:complete